MNRVLKIIISIVCAVILTVCTFVSAEATSAQLGETVVLRVNVNGESRMTSILATVSFDSSSFDFLSYDAPYGTSFCNDSVDGEVTWATLFDTTDGTDFTNETNIMSLTFIAKQDLNDVESLLSCSITEAYDADLKTVDPSKITVQAAVYGDEVLLDESTSSKTEFVISKYEGNTVSSQTAEDYFQGSDIASNENEASKFAEENTESNFDEASNTDLNSNNASVQSEDDSGTVVSTTSNGITVRYYESEFEEEPPIKVGAQDEPQDTDNRGNGKLYARFLVIGCLLIAAIAGVLLIIKEKSDRINGKHLE